MKRVLKFILASFDLRLLNVNLKVIDGYTQGRIQYPHIVQISFIILLLWDKMQV